MALPNGPVILLTREPEDNLGVKQALLQRRVPVLEIPCVATRFLDPGDLPAGFQAVVFTSRRGVEGLLRLPQAFSFLRSSPAPLICSVGESTSRALKDHQLESDLTADPPRGEVLAKNLVEKLVRPSRIALVCGNLTTGKMESILTSAAFELSRLVVYENYPPDIPVLAPAPVAAIFVASPSAGRRLLEINPWMKSCPFIAIGDTTASALKDLGIASVQSAGPETSDWIDLLGEAYQAAWNEEKSSANSDGGLWTPDRPAT